MSLPRPLKQMKEEARRDDWHTIYVGSDIRQLIGEVERLRETIRDIESVACGETQVAEDDTEGLRWIWQQCCDSRAAAKAAGGE